MVVVSTSSEQPGYGKGESAMAEDHECGLAFWAPQEDRDRQVAFFNELIPTCVANLVKRKTTQGSGTAMEYDPGCRIGTVMQRVISG